MNNLLKSFLCLLTTVSISSSDFCNVSNNFGIGLLLGTAKSKIKISKINELNQYCHEDFIKVLYYELQKSGMQDYEKYITIKNNPVSEKSDFRFDTGVIAFYQRNFNDTFFTRIGAFGNFTVANNTSSSEILNESISDKLRSQDINLKCNFELKHSFDVGGQLLLGFNLAKQFSIVFGGELGYTRGEARANITANDVEVRKSELLSFGSLFYGVVGGIEFNFKNVIVGVHGFLHTINLKDSNFKPNDRDYKNENNNKTNEYMNLAKLNNIGVRLMIAYKF